MLRNESHEKKLTRINEIKKLIAGGWDNFYKNEKIENIPWVDKELDVDLEEKLNTMRLNRGIFLDIGTGLGSQAVTTIKQRI